MKDLILPAPTSARRSGGFAAQQPMRRIWASIASSFASAASALLFMALALNTPHLELLERAPVAT